MCGPGTIFKDNSVEPKGPMRGILISKMGVLYIQSVYVCLASFCCVYSHNTLACILMAEAVSRTKRLESKDLCVHL